MERSKVGSYGPEWHDDISYYDANDKAYKEANDYDYMFFSSGKGTK